MHLSVAQRAQPHDLKGLGVVGMMGLKGEREAGVPQCSQAVFFSMIPARAAQKTAWRMACFLITSGRLSYLARYAAYLREYILPRARARARFLRRHARR